MSIDKLYKLTEVCLYMLHTCGSIVDCGIIFWEVIPLGKTSSSVKNRYNAKTYDRIEIVVPKGQKEAIKTAAASVGESVNGFIGKAITERMERMSGV